METNRRDKLLALVLQGLSDGYSLSLSRHKALKATKSNLKHSEELTKDPEFQQIRSFYLRKHTRDRRWTKD